MTALDKAICFAVKAHSGAVRKGTTVPYILHPLEAAAIAASITDDQDVIAAAVLHDVPEDAGVTPEELKREFGPRIAALVSAATEDRSDPRAHEETWKARKQHTIDATANASYEEKIVIFADKLANVRAIHRDYYRVWEELWERFNEKDPNEHLWYYNSFLHTCEEFSGTKAYMEYVRLIGDVGARVREYEDCGSHTGHLKLMAAPGNTQWVLQDENTGMILSVTDGELEELLKSN